MSFRNLFSAVVASFVCFSTISSVRADSTAFDTNLDQFLNEEDRDLIMEAVFSTVPLDVSVYEAELASSVYNNDYNMDGTANALDAEQAVASDIDSDGTITFYDANAVNAVLLQKPFTSPVNKFDVNGDGYETSLDLLILINKNNQFDIDGITELKAVDTFAPNYVDLSGDSRFTPLDMLQAANHLNNGGF